MFGVLVWIAKAALKVVGRASDNATEVAVAEIDSEVETRRFATEIRLATASFWEMRLITAAIAGCFTLHLVAVTLDTVFKLGWKVFAFPRPFNEWEGAIILSFFGVQLASRGLSTIASIFLRKR
jgi:hypothetical protein